eukprot:2714710-Heterocapsa_arctica.AAC.1
MLRVTCSSKLHVATTRDAEPGHLHLRELHPHPQKSACVGASLLIIQSFCQMHFPLGVALVCPVLVQC